MKKGVFISIEGSDGAGKSTQINLLRKYLEELDREVIITREPGGTAISEKIRELLLDKNNSEMASMTETLLYAAARAQLVSEVIKPALEQGKIVICDRFIDSSIAYQGYGRKLGDCVKTINEFAVDGCMPHVTFLMLINPETSTGRLKEDSKDRIEMEASSFHQAVYNGYLEIEKQYPDRIVGINAQRGIEEIHKDIRKKIDEIIGA